MSRYPTSESRGVQEIQVAAVTSYRSFLRTPQVLPFLISSMAGRLSFGVLPLALLLQVRAAAGSYATAGFATSAFAITSGVLMPFRARLIDVWGPRRGLVTLAAGYAFALASLPFLALVGANSWMLVIMSGVAGALPPPLGPATRAVYSRAWENSDSRRVAFSFDTVTEEILFIVGPLVADALVWLAGPNQAVLTAAALILIGTISAVSCRFVSRTRDAVPETGRSQHTRFLVLLPPILVVAACMLAVGAVFGSLTVALPAFAEHQHQASWSGLLIALLSAGSAVGGLWYGNRTWRRSPAAQLGLLVLVLPIGLAPLILAGTVLQLALLLPLVGLAVAPTISCGYVVAEAAAPAGRDTEAGAWANTGFNTGVAFGAAITGALITTTSVHWVFTVTVFFALLALPSWLLGRRRLAPN